VKPAAVRPARRKSSTQAATLLSFLDETTTLAPERAQASATARPMPRVEPVTTTTLFFKTGFMKIHQVATHGYKKPAMTNDGRESALDPGFPE
jgi:hypothetical protein